MSEGEYSYKLQDGLQTVEAIFNGELEPEDINKITQQSFQVKLNAFMRESFDGNVLEQIIYLKHAGIVEYSSERKEVVIIDLGKLKEYFIELYEHSRE